MSQAERRHRINGVEIGPVKEAVENELRALCSARDGDDLLKATALFRVWWRFETHREGQPNYPEPIDWPTISGYVNTMVPFPTPVEAVA